MLPTFKVIVSVATRRRFFSGHDRIEENIIELADLAYFKICHPGSNCMDRHRSHTFVNMNVRPDVLAFTYVDGFAQLDGQFDRTRDLLGMGVLETLRDKDVVGTTPNDGREDDPGPRIPCMYNG